MSTTNETAAPTGIEGGRNSKRCEQDCTRRPLRRKWQRVLYRLLEGPLHRFEAEKFPISDHVLNSTISDLKKRGVVVHAELVELPRYSGLAACVALYSLAPESFALARRLLGERS